MAGPDLVVEAPRAVVAGREMSCAVSVTAGRIVAVEEYGAAADAAEVVRLDDDVVLLPGLVDTHVHVNDPGRTDWEGFAHATRAAAAGGVTTIVDMPLNSVPVTVDVAALEAKRAAATGRCHVDVGFWGGAVPANPRDLQPLWEAGVLGFKCFLADSGVPEFPALDEHGLEATMAVVASFGGLLLVHAEDPDAVGPCPDSSTRYADFLASRPDSSELSAVEAVVDAARRTGCRAHVVHLSTAGALRVVAEAHDEGVPITAETCPHYLTFAAEDVPDGATAYKCCPPIRDAANRDLLWDGLAAGTIGCVVSDHSPCAPDLKALDTGRFADAWGGISSLQLGLPAVWTEARRRGHGLADVARWMSSGPAARAGLPRKGRIAVGGDADFCVLAPDESFVVDPERLQHRNPVTPYAGRKLTGVVRETWLAGRRVDIAGAPYGRLLRRGGGS
ncbi:MAG: allantoinase AllB [Nocardioidaceae bacterium]